MGRKTIDDIPSGFVRMLPPAAEYYARSLPAMTEPDVNGWASAACPLHHCGERVRVDLFTGWFACPKCGTGDLVLFHMIRTRLGFRAAVLDLLSGEWRDEHR